VAFSPTALQNYGGTIAVDSFAMSGDATIACSGTGVASIIGVSGDLAFGAVATGAQATAALTITNAGNVAFTVTNVVYPTGFAGAWTGIVEAGAATNIAVTFSPSAAQDFGGTVSVQSTATGGQGTIGCSGTGVEVGASANLLVTPAALDFGVTALASSTVLAFQVSNRGQQSLQGTTTVSPPFAIAFGETYELGAGQTGTVNVSFSPLATGPASGTVVFASTGGDASNSVLGVGGTSPALSHPSAGVVAAQMPLYGDVNPGGLPTFVWFEYGLTPSYGNVTAASLVPAGGVVANVALTASGLVAGLQYHYRMVASNGLGVTCGPDQLFAASGAYSGDVDGDGAVSQSELDAVLAHYWPNCPFLDITNTQALAGGRFLFELPNPGAWGFSVESTTDLVTWTTFTTAHPGYLFSDPTATNATPRAYRLRWP
jgi:hypothetical protein